MKKILLASLVVFVCLLSSISFAWYNNDWTCRWNVTSEEIKGYDRVGVNASYLTATITHGGNISDCYKEIRVIDEFDQSLPIDIIHNTSSICEVGWIGNITANTNTTFSIYGCNANATAGNYGSWMTYSSDTFNDTTGKGFEVNYVNGVTKTFKAHIYGSEYNWFTSQYYSNSLNTQNYNSNPDPSASSLVFNGSASATINWTTTATPTIWWETTFYRGLTYNYQHYGDTDMQTYFGVGHFVTPDGNNYCKVLGGSEADTGYCNVVDGLRSNIWQTASGFTWGYQRNTTHLFGYIVNWSTLVSSGSAENWITDYDGTSHRTYSYWTFENTSSGKSEVPAWIVVMPDSSSIEADLNTSAERFANPPVLTLGSKETYGEEAPYISLLFNFSSINFGSLVHDTTNNPSINAYRIDVNTSGCTNTYVEFDAPATPLNYSAYTIANSNFKFNYTKNTTPAPSLNLLNASYNISVVNNDIVYPFYFLTIPAKKEAGAYSTTHVIKGVCV